MRRGYAAGIAAFTLWGLFPVYWRALAGISPDAIVALRTLGCVPVLIAIILWKKETALCRGLIRKPGISGLHLLAAVLLGGNWLTFIMATQQGQIMQASLGYFLTPMANVLCGVLFFREKPRPAQLLAIALAAAGVVLQVIAVGGLPWIALVLALTFSLYGLVRKLSPADSLHGLTIESFWAVPVASLWLWWHPLNMAVPSTVQWWLLGLVGIVTVVPLLWFGSAARRIPMSHLGLLQFLAPSLQFLSGWLAGEPLSAMRLISFAVIWLGCAVFVRDLLRKKQN